MKNGGLVDGKNMAALCVHCREVVRSTGVPALNYVTPWAARSNCRHQLEATLKRSNDPYPGQKGLPLRNRHLLCYFIKIKGAKHARCHQNARMNRSTGALGSFSPLNLTAHVLVYVMPPYAALRQVLRTCA